VRSNKGALSWGLQAATNLARLWRDRNRTHKAHRLLASVYGRFSEGFETADLKAAEALIAQLR
jgi:predicted ATPase